jgi:hypothetical protein
LKAVYPVLHGREQEISLHGTCDDMYGIPISLALHFLFLACRRIVDWCIPLCVLRWCQI